MQIIIMHPRFSAHALTLTGKHIALLAFLFLAAVLTTTLVLYYLVLQMGATANLPLVRDVMAAATQQDSAGKDRYLKENLSAMAAKLGEMQAQLMRLDALGERVQGLAGVKPEEFNFREKPGRGGAAPLAPGADAAKPWSMSEFQAALDAMARDVETRSDYLNVVESTLMSHKVQAKLLPTIQPVNVGYNASGFGWRVDPFTRRTSFHEGIDFAAPAGTPIVAAAGGVVIAAEYHHQYGNMLEIDHGNHIATRYAHASKLLVNVGDIVRRGQHVADIGSTGRSTGAHLHFEVLVKGVQQNPHKFLTAGSTPLRVAGLYRN